MYNIMCEYKYMNNWKRRVGVCCNFSRWSLNFSYICMHHSLATPTHASFSLTTPTLAAGFAKDNYVHAVPLPFFHGRRGDKVLDKQKLSAFRVPGSKGTHCFCTTPLEEKYLRLFVAVKTKVCMLMWKHKSESLPKNLAEMKIAEEFQMHRVGGGALCVRACVCMHVCTCG